MEDIKGKKKQVKFWKLIQCFQQEGEEKNAI